MKIPIKNAQILLMTLLVLVSMSAHADFLRVDFNGVTENSYRKTSGTYSGWFTYDDTPFENTPHMSRREEPYFETELVFEIDHPGVLQSYSSWDETTASVWRFRHENGELLEWWMGGDANGPYAWMNGTPDFRFRSGDNGYADGSMTYPDWSNWPNTEQIKFNAATFHVTPTTPPTIIPLPASFWFLASALFCVLSIRKGATK